MNANGSLRTVHCFKQIRCTNGVLTIFWNSICTFVWTYKIRIYFLTLIFETKASVGNCSFICVVKITHRPFYRNKNIFILSPFTHLLTLYGGLFRFYSDTLSTTYLHKKDLRRGSSIPTNSDSETSYRTFSYVPTTSINPK